MAGGGEAGDTEPEPENDGDARVVCDGTGVLCESRGAGHLFCFQTWYYH